MKSAFTRSAAAVALAFSAIGAHAAGATITVTCSSSGTGFELCKKYTGEWAAKTGNTVKLFTLPTSSTETLALYRQMFAAHSSDLDVMDVDTVWPGMIKDHLVDLSKYTKGAEKEHFPRVIANNTVDGKLLAMPFFIDAGLLYYRKDLMEKYGVKVPTTWDEMADAAKKITKGERDAGAADFQGYVFQGKAYEGLTCNALEWVYSYGGGTIIDESGKVTINNPNAVAALKAAKSWVGTITPTGVMNYAEEDSRGVFQNGKAAFMRNWPYAWALSQGTGSPIKGKIGVMPLPKGGANGKNVATLGGWQMAVSKYSKNPDAAADLVMYLTSPAIQKDRAIRSSANLTIMSLYKDKDILAANPFFGDLYDVFTNAVARPATVTGAKYSEVSSSFWNMASDVLSNKATPEDALKRLEGRLNQIVRAKR